MKNTAAWTAGILAIRTADNFSLRKMLRLAESADPSVANIIRDELASRGVA